MNFLPEPEIELPFAKEIDALANTTLSHNCLNNDFYRLWVSEELTAEAFSIFAVNYFSRVHATTQRLSIALASIDDWISRLEILHNISDELGNGHVENVHVTILYRWINALSIKLNLPEFSEQLENSVLLDETRDFVQKTNDLCAKGPLQACGALLAQEWHGYSQLGLLYEGFRNYSGYFDLDEFHDLGEYFYVHLGRAEKEHKVQANIIAARHCKTHADLEKITESFTEYLKLLENFWNAIFSEIISQQESSENVVKLAG